MGQGQTRGSARVGRNLSITTEIVFQELDVPLENPVDIARGTNPVIKAVKGGIALSRRAAPVCSIVRAVAVLVALREKIKLILRLAFFPTCTVFSKDEKVGGMKHAKTASVTCSL